MRVPTKLNMEILSTCLVAGEAVIVCKGEITKEKLWGL